MQKPGNCGYSRDVAPCIIFHSFSYLRDNSGSREMSGTSVSGLNFLRCALDESGLEIKSPYSKRGREVLLYKMQVQHTHTKTVPPGLCSVTSLSQESSPFQRPRMQ